MNLRSPVHDIPNDNIISARHGHNGPGGVCVSRDFGASWKHEAQGIPPKPVTSIVLDPKSPKDARTPGCSWKIFRKRSGKAFLI